MQKPDRIKGPFNVRSLETVVVLEDMEAEEIRGGIEAESLLTMGDGRKTYHVLVLNEPELEKIRLRRGQRLAMVGSGLISRTHMLYGSTYHNLLCMFESSWEEVDEQRLCFLRVDGRKVMSLTDQSQINRTLTYLDADDVRLVISVDVRGQTYLGDKQTEAYWKEKVTLLKEIEERIKDSRDLSSMITYMAIEWDGKHTRCRHCSDDIQLPTNEVEAASDGFWCCEDLRDEWWELVAGKPAPEEGP